MIGMSFFSPAETVIPFGKNQAALAAGEKARFIAAVLQVKANGGYDHYVRQHRDLFNEGIQLISIFLPWHREFLRRFEQDLQAIDPTVNLSYRDWTVDRSSGAPIRCCASRFGDLLSARDFPRDSAVVAVAYDAPCRPGHRSDHRAAVPSPGDRSFHDHRPVTFQLPMFLRRPAGRAIPASNSRRRQGTPPYRQRPPPTWRPCPWCRGRRTRF